MEDILITAAVHGNEIGSVLVARELRGWVEGNNIQGVDIEPELNLEAIEQNQRESPKDEKDLNRCFPGDKDGTYTERLAHNIFQKAKEYDIVIDLHTYGEKSRCVPYMLTDLNQVYNREICMDIGIPHAVQTGGQSGQMFIELSKLGIPAMIIEAGSASHLGEELDIVLKSLKSYLKGKKYGEVTYFKRYERIQPDDYGEFTPIAELGDSVDQGQKLGHLNGKPIEAPFSGKIIGMMTAENYDPEEDSVYALAERE